MLSIRSAGVLDILEKGFTILALFLYAGSLLPLASGTAEGAYDPTRGSPVSQAIFLTLYVLTFCLIFTRRKQLVRVLLRDKFLLLLVGLALVSVLWATAPEVTLRRSVALMGTTLFGVYLAVRYDLKEQLRLLAWALGIGALLSLLFALALPTYGVMTDLTATGWRGVYGHKNALGALMVLSALVFVLLNVSGRRYRWLCLAGFGFSVGLLLLSNSKTSLVAFITLLSLLPFYRALRWRYTLAVPVFIAAVLVGGGVATLILSNTEAVFDALGRDATLTDRTEIWSAVIHMIREQPWLGYGYGGFWLGWDGASAYVLLTVYFDPLTAHNGVLDLWLDLGLLGVVVFTLGFVMAYLRAITWVRAIGSVVGLWPLAYLTLVLLQNLTESVILTQNDIFWVLYVAVVLSMPARRAQAVGGIGGTEAGDPVRDARSGLYGKV